MKRRKIDRETKYIWRRPLFIPNSQFQFWSRSWRNKNESFPTFWARIPWKMFVKSGMHFEKRVNLIFYPIFVIQSTKQASVYRKNILNDITSSKNSKISKRIYSHYFYIATVNYGWFEKIHSVIQKHETCVSIFSMKILTKFLKEMGAGKGTRCRKRNPGLTQNIP